MKSVVIHALLALSGLTLAYLTWTREADEEVTVGEVTIAECDVEQLRSVVVDTPRYTNTVVPRRAGDTPAFWIAHQRKPKPSDADTPTETATEHRADGGVPQGQKAGEPADAGTVAVSGHGAVPLEPEPEVFVPNEKFARYLDTLSPLRAYRNLGKLEPQREAEFGFDEVDTHFRFACDDRQLELEVGGRTYGTGKRYVRRRDTGEVYLVDGSLVQDLQSARYKFRQTDLHTFPLEAVLSARVTAAGMERKLMQRKLAQEGAARWVDEAEPDKRNELFGNWFSRVAKLRVNTYLGEKQQPGDDLEPADGAHAEPETVVEIAYATRSGGPGRLEIVRVVQGDQTHYYGRTETTQKWVKLYSSAAKLVAEDAGLVVGAEPADGSAEPPPPSGRSPGVTAPGAPGPSPHGTGTSPHGTAGPHGGVHP